VAGVSTLPVLAFLLKPRTSFNLGMTPPVLDHLSSKRHGRDFVPFEGSGFCLPQLQYQVAGVEADRSVSARIERTASHVSVPHGLPTIWREVLCAVGQLIADGTKASARLGPFFSRIAPRLTKPLWQVSGGDKEVKCRVGIDRFVRQPSVIGFHFVQQVQGRLELKEARVVRHLQSIHVEFDVDRAALESWSDRAREPPLGHTRTLSANELFSRGD
jgi:hypothetical protein